MTDNSDNSVNDSYNDNSLGVISGSYNSSMDDHSVTVGVRDYNTGIGDLDLGGAGGGGGDVWVNNQNTIVDQSVNGAGDGDFSGGGSAVVASGDGSMAAGEGISITQVRDSSTTISADGGDVNLNNDTRITTIDGSYNTSTVETTWTDNSVDTSIADSYNDNSDSYTAADSFNDSSESYTSTDSFNDNSDSYSAADSFNDLSVTHDESNWNIDADVIWGSDDSVIAQDATVDVDPGDWAS